MSSHQSRFEKFIREQAELHPDFTVKTAVQMYDAVEIAFEIDPVEWTSRQTNVVEMLRVGRLVSAVIQLRHLRPELDIYNAKQICVQVRDNLGLTFIGQGKTFAS